jgi:branched-chain amino acid transport system substrate-binding protein
MKRLIRMIITMSMVVAPLAGISLTTAALSQPAGAATGGAPINIGDIASLTGPEASSIDQTTEVLEAWAKEVNAKGGIAGHKVNLIVKDDGYNPTTSLSQVEGMVTGSHIVALVDNSDVDTSWYKYIEAQKIPVIGGQTEDGPYESADFFDPGSTFDDFPLGEAYLTKLVHSTKTADLYCAEVALCTEALAPLKADMPKFGSKMVYTSAISFAAPSYAAQCIAAKQAGATSMTVGDATQVVNKVVQDCAAQGYTPIQISADGTIGQSWLTIPQFNGNVDAQPDVPFFVHNAATNPMYAALTKYYPQQLTNPNFGEIVVENWADAILIQDALEAGKLTATPTAAEVTAGMYALPQGTTLGGLTPPLHFTKGQPTHNACFFYMGIKNGKFYELPTSTVKQPLCLGNK